MFNSTANQNSDKHRLGATSITEKISRLTRRTRASPAHYPWLSYIAAIAGVFIIGEIDYISGSEIHVNSLYFVPLAFAGWRLGTVRAMAVSLLATFVWLAVLFVDSDRHLPPYVLLANFLTQGAAFLTIAILVASLSEALRKESANNRTDALTGLKNRLGFIEQSSLALSLCTRHARPVALAYLDLDNFKQVNDSLGHARGDVVLQKCGSVIAQSLRTTDIAARFGGDEFVIFLPETTAENAVALFERMLHTLEVSAEFNSVGVTASIGIVIEETASLDIHQLIEHADSYMYVAKRDGKNRIGTYHVVDEQNSS